MHIASSLIRRCLVAFCSFSAQLQFDGVDSTQNTIDCAAAGAARCELRCAVWSGADGDWTLLPPAATALTVRQIPPFLLRFVRLGQFPLRLRFERHACGLIAHCVLTFRRAPRL